MIDNKLNDRQKNFSNNLKGSKFSQSNCHIRKREEFNMNLRKNKLADFIMEKRFKELNKSGHISIDKKFEIDIKKLNIPQSLISNYEKHSDKLIVISKLLDLKEESEGENKNNEEDPIKQFAIFCLRKYISDKDSLDQDEVEFIKNNIFENLEFIFFQQFPKCYEEKQFTTIVKIKFEISWIFINLTKENTFSIEKLLNISSLKRMEQLIDECLNLSLNYKLSTSALIKHIFWLFSNLLGEDQESNTIIRNTINLPEKLNYFLNINNIRDLNNLETSSLILVAIWTVQNLVRYVFADAKYFYKDLLVNLISVMKLAVMRESNNIEIIKESLDAFVMFTNNSDLVQVFIDNQIIPVLINCFGISSQSILNLVKIFSELLAGTNEQINYLLSYPLLDKLYEIILTINSRTTTMMIENNENFESDCNIIKETCMAISNICASTQENIEKIVCNESLVEILIQIYEKFPNKVKYEILYIFYNSFVVGNNYIKSEIIKKNIHIIYISKLNEIWDNKNPSKIMTKLILEALLVFIDFGEKNSSKLNFIKKEVEDENIVIILEKLQYDINSDIYDLANQLLQRYWGNDEIYYNDPSDLIR